MSKSTRDSSDAPIVTDPYTVPVGKTAPNNPPFIVKRSKELPAGQKSFRSHNTRKRKEKGEDSQVDTTHYVPEALPQATVKRTGLLSVPGAGRL
jgi:hypothetical protein